MIIHLYSILRNEIKILPYFLRHYQTFVNEFFIFDDDSDDGTAEELGKYKNITILKPGMHGIDDRHFRGLHQNEYKLRSRGKCDIVICVDADEFIYNSELVDELEKFKNSKNHIVKPEGWTMFSENFCNTDGQIYDEIKTGYRDVWYDKPIIFKPSIDIKWDLGRHGVKEVDMPGVVINKESKIKLLHYRYLGKKYCEERHARDYSRLSERNLKWKLGRHVIPGSKYYHSLKWFEHTKRHGEIIKCI